MIIVIHPIYMREIIIVIFFIHFYLQAITNILILINELNERKKSENIREFRIPGRKSSL